MGLPTTDGSSLQTRSDGLVSRNDGSYEITPLEPRDDVVQTTVQQTAVKTPEGFHESKSVMARIRRKWGPA